MAKETRIVTQSTGIFGKKSLIVIVAIILFLFPVVSCSSVDKTTLGIYLADTGELVLSDADIQAYDTTEDAIILNQDGIQKWNSHSSSETPPKLNDGLFSREFSIKIDGQELCRGKFWSGVSSQSYSGIVIMDSIFRLDSDHNKLYIKADYPGAASLSDTIKSEFDKCLNK